MKLCVHTKQWLFFRTLDFGVWYPNILQVLLCAVPPGYTILGWEVYVLPGGLYGQYSHCLWRCIHTIWNVGLDDAFYVASGLPGT